MFAKGRYSHMVQHVTCTADQQQVQGAICAVILTATKQSSTGDLAKDKGNRYARRTCIQLGTALQPSGRTLIINAALASWRAATACKKQLGSHLTKLGRTLSLAVSNVVTL